MEEQEKESWLRRRLRDKVALATDPLLSGGSTVPRYSKMREVPLIGGRGDTTIVFGAFGAGLLTR
jgi:hypothetical protein